MKISTQEIIDLIASKSGQTKKFSEQFLKELVDVIAEYLQKDGSVKVKGLGTFKVVTVEERKSVDVATGKEIILPSHSKVQFIPEDAVKQQVNAPLSHLQTVSVDPVKQETTAPQAVQAQPAEPVKPVTPAQPVAPAQSEPEKPEKPKKKKKHHIWWIFLLLIIAIVVGAYFTRPYWLPYGRKALMKVERLAGITPDTTTVTLQLPEPEIVEEEVIDYNADETLIAYQDSISNEQTSETQVFDIHSYTYQMALDAPVKGYEIVRDGSRLTMVALRAYGSKDFWVYIYDANRRVLSKPQDIETGMRLDIADLPAELVDPESQEALEFARELAKKY